MGFEIRRGLYNWIMETGQAELAHQYIIWCGDLEETQESDEIEQFIDDLDGLVVEYFPSYETALHFMLAIKCGFFSKIDDDWVRLKGESMEIKVKRRFFDWVKLQDSINLAKLYLIWWGEIKEPMEKEIAAWFDDLDVWLMDNEEHKYTSILQLLLDLRSGKFVESDEWISLKDKDNDK